MSFSLPLSLSASLSVHLSVSVTVCVCGMWGGDQGEWELLDQWSQTNAVLSRTIALSVTANTSPTSSSSSRPTHRECVLPPPPPNPPESAIPVAK